MPARRRYQVPLSYGRRSGVPASACGSRYGRQRQPQCHVAHPCEIATHRRSPPCNVDVEIKRRSKENAVARRLMTIPGVGPITATAVLALAPAAETFKTGRDFAAWLGLTPLQRSTGGKQRLGATSKRGERTIRRLLILGGSAVVRHACAKGAAAGSWLAQMLARKPRMLVTVALANKTARIIWALLVKGEEYRAPAVA